MKRYIGFIVLVFIVLFSGCSKKDNLDSQKIITDEAFILRGNTKLIKQFKEYNKQLLKDFDIDFRVITTAEDKDMNIFSNKRFNLLQSNSKSKSGKAILLVVNVLQDKVRLEISKALEPIYTDAFVFYIERKGFVPYFRDNKIVDGIYMAVELIRDRAYEAKQAKEWMPPMKSESEGGGAKSDANIGKKDKNAKAGGMVEANKQDNPLQVRAKYIQALKNHNKNPNLEIYTDATKEFFKKWTVTDINQDHEVQMLSKCKNPEVRYSPDKTHAVIYFPVKKRKCAPYFLAKENGAWKLDIASMSKLILFNQDMKWHFNLQWKDKLKPYIYGKLQWSRIIPKDIDALLEPYKFAFLDLSFDKNGYPFNLWEGARFGLGYDEYIVKGEYLGIFINDLYSKGVALKSGLRVWDKIISWDGKKIQKGDMKYLENSMKNAPAGKVITVVVQRRVGKKSYKNIKIDMVAP